MNWITLAVAAVGLIRDLLLYFKKNDCTCPKEQAVRLDKISKQVALALNAGSTKPKIDI